MELTRCEWMYSILLMLMVSISCLSTVRGVIVLILMPRVYDSSRKADSQSFSYLLHPLLGNLAKRKYFLLMS